MKSKRILGGIAAVAISLNLGACAKTAPAAAAPVEPKPAVEEAPAAVPLKPVSENTERVFVEGVAGGVMLQTVQLEAEVVSVDQEKRAAVLRGPEGNEVTVQVGEGAVNFYQVKVGSRVSVKMARELVIYVADEDEEAGEDGSAAVAAGAKKGESPAGVVVASSKVTSKISSMDVEARTATLKFEDGKEETFNVRPDVDMTKYSVGQDVVFLITEMLALEVKKI